MLIPYSSFPLLDLLHYVMDFEVVNLDWMFEVHNGNFEMLLGMPLIGVSACSPPTWISWIPPSYLLWTCLTPCPTTKVVKIDVTWPFCIPHHVNVYPTIRNNMLTFILPPLQLVTENKFWSPFLWQPKFFGCQPCSDQNFSITNLAMTKSFWSSNLQQLKNFNCL